MYPASRDRSRLLPTCATVSSAAKAQEHLRQAEAHLQAAELAPRASQERYDVGAHTLVELTQSRSAFVQAASDRMTARYGLLFQDRLMSYYPGTMAADRVTTPCGGFWQRRHRARASHARASPAAFPAPGAANAAALGIGRGGSRVAGAALHCDRGRAGHPPSWC